MSRGVTLAPAEQDGAQRNIAGDVRSEGIFCPASTGELGYQRGERPLYSGGKRRVEDHGVSEFIPGLADFTDPVG